jgi:peptidoglycan/xylan/chitin deacetylase (PgdA/CDA1 family)
MSQAAFAPRLLITVDTELSSFPGSQGLWGRVDGEQWGLPKLIALFEEAGVRATFFVDAYAAGADRLAEQARAARVAAAAGHDVQLHTHPAESFDRERGQMRRYDAGEQARILEFGRARLAEWSGRAPVLHRAGDWAADRRTLAALRQLGFRADFSACPWARDCALEGSIMAGNGWTRMEGLLCGVGTCYRDRLTGRIRRLDLGGSSFAEAADIVARDLDPLILTLHSFSLLRYDRSRTRFAPDPAYASRLRRFCELAMARGYVSSTALDAVADVESRADAALPWQPLPTTLAWSSCAGIFKSAAGRLRA